VALGSQKIQNSRKKWYFKDMDKKDNFTDLVEETQHSDIPEGASDGQISDSDGEVVTLDN